MQRLYAGKGEAMTPEFVIRTIHERRKGIDMITMPYEQETRYAAPANHQVKRVDTSDGGCEIPL